MKKLCCTILFLFGLAIWASAQGTAIRAIDGLGTNTTFRPKASDAAGMSITTSSNVWVKGKQTNSSTAYFEGVIGYSIYSKSNIYSRGRIGVKVPSPQGDLDVDDSIYAYTNIVSRYGRFIGSGASLTNVPLSEDSTNWILAQIASLGSYQYFGGPTNTISMKEVGAADFRTNVWSSSLTPFPTAGTSSVGGLVVNAYVRNVISTNRYSVIEAGPVSLKTYPFRSGGAGTVAGRYEFYVVDCVSNNMYELASSPAVTISATVPTLIETSLTLTNTFIATNECFYAIAFKVTSAGSGGPQLHWAHGGPYDAHVTFTRPLSSATISGSQVSGNVPADIARNTGFGTNTTFYGNILFTTNWSFSTNVLASTNLIDLLVAEPFIQAAGTISISNFANLSDSEVRYSTLTIHVPSGDADRTVRVPDSVRTMGGSKSWVATNGIISSLTIKGILNRYTNAVFTSYY